MGTKIKRGFVYILWWYYVITLVQNVRIQPQNPCEFETNGGFVFIRTTTANTILSCSFRGLSWLYLIHFFYKERSTLSPQIGRLLCTALSWNHQYRRSVPLPSSGQLHNCSEEDFVLDTDLCVWSEEAGFFKWTLSLYRTCLDTKLFRYKTKIRTGIMKYMSVGKSPQTTWCTMVWDNCMEFAHFMLLEIHGWYLIRWLNWFRTLVWICICFTYFEHNVPDLNKDIRNNCEVNIQWTQPKT